MHTRTRNHHYVIKSIRHRERKLVVPPESAESRAICPKCAEVIRKTPSGIWRHERTDDLFCR